MVPQWLSNFKVLYHDQLFYYIWQTPDVQLKKKKKKEMIKNILKKQATVFFKRVSELFSKPLKTFLCFPCNVSCYLFMSKNNQTNIKKNLSKHSEINELYLGPFKTYARSNLLIFALCGYSQTPICTLNEWTDKRTFCFRLKSQSCKFHNNKYMIASIQIKNTDIYAFTTILVFKLLNR